MNVLVFDTETTSLEKPYCYNIGYCILNIETATILASADYVVEQVWHNLPLFNSAYYANKREIYISRMKGQTATLDKFGYICRRMANIMKEYDIHYAYAFNSDFDEKVFNFNCDWFKCFNPFENIEIRDIRAYAIDKIVDEAYKKFCEDNEYFTDSGNYSTTAEIFTRFLRSDLDFNEEHTALSDSLIEAEILMECYNKGADITEEKKAKRSIERKITRYFKVLKDGVVLLNEPYSSARFYNGKTEVRLKS